MRFMGHLARGLGLVALAAGIAVATASGAPPPKGYTCSGGSIPGGTYASLTVTGTCAVDSGSVNVTNDATVEHGAALVAAFGGSDLAVGGDLLVRNNAILVLGCEPEAFIFPRPGSVNGTLARTTASGTIWKANNALSVLAHHNTIGHDASVNGGGAPGQHLRQHRALRRPTLRPRGQHDRRRVDHRVPLCWLASSGTPSRTTSATTATRRRPDGTRSRRTRSAATSRATATRRHRRSGLAAHPTPSPPRARPVQDARRGPRNADDGAPARGAVRRAAKVGLRRRSSAGEHFTHEGVPGSVRRRLSEKCLVRRPFLFPAAKRSLVVGVQSVPKPSRPSRLSPQNIPP